ncbi:hypothetical protein [Pandoraea pnomenusa]|uniref:hypothetical protein n=1 Tax=Pandoraea pnomenusa TaxID=93220 RepID=UPI00333E6676
MSRQEFYSQVGQVAGRDIINEASEMLWECETPALKREFKRCNAKLWQMRRAIFLNVPFFWFIAGTMGSVWLLLTGTWFKISTPVMFAWLVGATLIPTAWLTAIRQRKGKMVAYYRERIEIIDTILQDRM